jgi:tRNA(Arg) A34 adenosine deaminase TadA
MQQDFMRRAIELSRLGMRAGKGGPFGAVVVRGDEIIAEGHNEVFLRKDPTAHAEVVAIRRAAAALDHFRLEGCEIYTSCEPCPMCLAAIYWARIEKIHFANTADDARRIAFDDRDLYREMTLPRAERHIPVRQMLRDEAFTVFREWQEKADHIDY